MRSLSKTLVAAVLACTPLALCSADGGHTSAAVDVELAEFCFSTGTPVLRTVEVRREMLDEKDEVSERHVLLATAELHPRDSLARSFEVKMERIAIEYQECGKEGWGMAIDTGASFPDAPMTWWRARNLRQSIQEPLLVVLDASGRPQLDASSRSEPVSELVQVASVCMISIAEHLFEGQQVEVGSRVFVKSGEGIMKLLGEGLVFEIEEITQNEIVAKFDEVGEGKGGYKGHEGSLRWNRHDALICQFEQRSDYCLEEDQPKAIPCREYVRITSAVVS